MPGRFVRFIFAALLVLALAACAGTPDSNEEQSGEATLTEEEREIARLEAELQSARADLSAATFELEAQVAESDELRRTVQELEETIAGLRDEISAIDSQYEELSAAQDAEIADLRAEREALLLDLRRVSNAAEIAASQTLARSTGSASTAATSTTSAAALADALNGLGGFIRVPSFSYQIDRRMTARLAVASAGLAVDSSGEDDVLYDANLDYDQSLLYLTITDPAGRTPRLFLTAQYVTDVEPLYARTAFVSIVGTDPIDPVDPIVFTGNPIRETDGERLREAFTREVDRSLLNRLSAMLSTSAFSGTFVGATGQEVHRPSLLEREAMSRVLFAFIDLGGL